MYKIKYLNLEHRFYILLIILLLACSVTVIYVQKNIINNAKRDSVYLEMSAIHSEFVDSLNAYNAMIKVVNNKIVERGIEKDPSAIIKLLKQFYAESKYSDSKIHINDLNWQKADSSVAVNRYGTLNPIILSPSIENEIKISPKKSHLYDTKIKGKLPEVYELFLSQAVIDKNKTYLGKLTILLDIKKWLDSIKARLKESGDILIILNASQEPIFSTINLETKLPEIIISNNSNLQKEINFNNYLITHYFKAEPYTVLHGYNKDKILTLSLNKIKSLLIMLWSCGFIFALHHYYHNKKLTAEIEAKHSKAIDNLKRSKRNLSKNYKFDVTDLGKQCDIYEQQILDYKKLFEAIRIANTAKNEIESKLISNLTSKVADLKMITYSLIKGVYGELKAPITSENLVDLLTNMHNRLDQMETCCPENKTKIVVNIQLIIEYSLKLFSKEIHQNQLTITIDVESKMKDFLFDELLFTQIMANLLHESISFSRTKGKMDISAKQEKENLIITIEDDGFYLSVEPMGGIEEPTSWLKLNMHFMKCIIESLGGVLTATFGQTKIISMQLPYQSEPLPTKELVIAEGENIVHFKKR